MGIVNVTPDSFSDGGRHAAADGVLDLPHRTGGRGAGRCRRAPCGAAL